MINKVRLSFVLVAGYIFLCLLHYLSPREYWLDELYVFENLVKFRGAQFFQELNPVQSFPRIYLVVLKEISDVFTYHPQVLRFLSLVFMLTAFFCWIKIYRVSISEKKLFLITLLAFVGSYRMSYYASELKPYSMDVLVVALFCLFLIYQKGLRSAQPTLKTYILSAALPALMFFSYAGLFVFWIVAFNWLLMLRENKRLMPVFLATCLSSIICFILVYKIDIQHSVTSAGVNYWKATFICLDSASCFFDTFGDGIKRFVVFWGGDHHKIFRRAAVIFIPFFLYSIVRYGFLPLKRDGFKVFSVGSLGFLLLVELFVVSALGKYPFTGQRITLFFAPFVFYFVALGIWDLRRWRFPYYLFMGYFIAYYSVCFLNALGVYWRQY